MRASPNDGLTDTNFMMPECRNKREAIAAHEFDRTEKPRPLRQGPGLDLPTAAKLDVHIDYDSRKLWPGQIQTPQRNFRWSRAEPTRTTDAV